MHKYARYAWRLVRPIVGIAAIFALLVLAASLLAIFSPALAIRIYIEEFASGKLPSRGPTDEELQADAWEISGVRDLAAREGRAQ